MIRTIFFALLFSLPAAHAADAIETVQVKYADVPLGYSAEGVVEAVKQSTVSAQISGRVSSVNFDVGDTVKKGQILVRIDATEVSHALNESRAMLAEAQASFENAKATYERTLHLFGRKFVSQAALDRAKAEYEAAKSRVDARQANVGIAANTESYATVVAPYGGVVASRHVEVGEMAYPGKPLMTGFDPSELRLTVSIPQYRLEAVRDHIGQETLILLDQGKPIRAASVTILPEANMLTHTTRVRLRFPADTHDVYPGMFARAQFNIGHARKLLIPAASVLRRSEVTAVYVVNGPGKYELRQVRLGEPYGENEIEVLAGLSAGESVALDPVRAGIHFKSMK